MMIFATLAICFQAQDPIIRPAAAYWFPASEGIEKWLPHLAEEELFDRWIVDPKPNILTSTTAGKNKIKIVSPSGVITTANNKWRSATIEFVQGKISPSLWLKKTAKLGETYHYLTTPKTPGLRSLTADIPSGVGAFSGRAVFAETLVCYWPGLPCFYSTDLFRTSYFPDDKRHESWVLAMNDFVGPMLNIRVEHPELAKQKPTIIRADLKPGMLIFQQKIGKKTFTFYFNNGLDRIKLPKDFKTELAIIARGLDLDTANGPYIMGSGTMMTIDPAD